MLTVSIEYIRYKKLTIIEDFHFELKNGESLLITGCSGSGKSTILLLIAGLLEKHNGTDFNAKIEFKSNNQSQIAYISQNPATNIITNDVKSELAINCGGNIENIKSALMLFDFPLILLERKTRHLSGGEQQLLAIVCAYLRNSNLYLLDEPTEMLDCYNKEIVTKAIKSLKEAGKTLIIATHETDIWNEFDQKIYLNRKGNIYEPFLLKGYLSTICRSPIKFDINELSFWYSKNEPIFTNINASFTNGDVVLIEGRNGSGKTTFAKLLATLLKSSKGNITLNGTNIYKIKSFLPTYLSFSFQNPDNQLLFSTVKEEIEYCPINYNHNAIDNLQSVFQSIKNINIDQITDPRETSFGQRKYLTNFSFCHFSPIHILDEPEIGTDKIMQKYFFDYVKIRKEIGLITILITHNPNNYSTLITQNISLSK
jgi:energy-coupling factor transport system ATP-binding protein